MELLLHQVLAGLATGGIYACLALALVMIYQAIDHLNFAQGEMAMFSTFIAWQLMQWGVPYWWAFLITIAFSFGAGIVVERALFKPLTKAPILTQVAGVIAGILIAPVVFLEPNMMLGTLVYGFAAAVLGGLTSPLGAVVGGFLVGVFENLAGTYIPNVGNELKLPIALALIITVLVIKPAGLFGRPSVKRV